MEDENIDYLIEAGKRDISDPCELNRLHEIATRHIEKHQRSCKSASVSIFLYNKFKFYEFEGKKSCQEYLDSLGYSKGAISHMLRYGEFIVMMGFSENQIPPEYLVRPILTNYNKENWREIYRNACEDYRMHKELQRIGDIPVNDDDEDDDDEDDDDGDIKTNVVKSVKKDSPTESNPISKSRTVSEKKHDSHESKDSTRKSGDDGDDDNGNNDDDKSLFDNIPRKEEIENALFFFQMDDEDNIYLTSIGAIIPRGETFTCAVLEKFKDTINTVSILCNVIKEFTQLDSETLSKEDIAAIKKICKEIHSREEKELDDEIGVYD